MERIPGRAGPVRTGQPGPAPGDGEAQKGGTSHHPVRADPEAVGPLAEQLF